jgi:uncharacterized protein (DUF2132 family)
MPTFFVSFSISKITAGKTHPIAALPSFLVPFQGYTTPEYEITGRHMTAHISKDPLHGVTLEMQVNALVARYGWSELGKLISINCFKNDPSVKSSLKFLRRTPWARAEVEALYLDSLSDDATEEPDVLAFNPWANSRITKS